VIFDGVVRMALVGNRVTKNEFVPHHRSPCPRRCAFSATQAEDFVGSSFSACIAETRLNG
jgi:hypothetical protein